MTAANVITFKSLEMDDVKINEVQGNKTSNITRGKLEVCYSPEFDRFVFRVNSFKYALSSDLPTIAYIAPNAFRSYMIPTISGYYLLRMKTMQPPSVIQNFETILSHYTQFSYRTGQEVELSLQAQGKEYLKTFDPNSNANSDNQYTQETPNKSDNYAKVGNAINVGGEYLKQKIMKAANYVGKNLQNTKDINVKDYTVKSIEELKSNNQMIEFSRAEFQGMIMLCNEIEKANIDRYPADPQTEKENLGWEGFKKTTSDSAKSLWRGMNEAATILSNAYKKRKANNTKNNEAPKEMKQEQCVQVFQGNKPEASLPKGNIQIQSEINQDLQKQIEINEDRQQQQHHPDIKQEIIQQEPLMDASERKVNIYPQLDSIVNS